MKIRKIKHRHPKYFGESNEKWARGGGRYGYGGRYGLNKHGSNIDFRSKREHISKIENDFTEQDIKDFENGR